MTINKTLFIWALLFIFLGILNSCRQEELFEQTQKEKKNFKVYMLNKKQVTDDFFLFDKVAKIQNVLIERNAQARSVQDSILDGGTISINKVLFIENENGIKTYTFPLKRSFASSKIENLVLKRNVDSTFSGVLMQYDITPTEKEMFNNWSSIDIKPKTKIINIDNLSINTSARIVQYQIGCFILEYEDGTCASTCQHTNPAECRLKGSQAPQPPRILSITAIPDCEPSGGDNGSTSNPPENSNNPPSNPTYPMSGGDNNTMLFDDYDLTYYNSDDMTDPDFQFYYQVNQWMQSQPQIVKDLNNEYHYVFYFIHTYFKTNGLNNNTKAFVSQRLLQIAQWYYDQTTGSHLDYEQKKSIAIWSVKHLLENPDISWEDYKNQFLTSPCEKIKNTTNSINGLKNKLITLNTHANLTLNYERGATVAEDTQGNTTLTPKDGNPGQTSIEIETPANGSVIIYLHTHFIAPDMLPTFSFEDLITFDAIHYWRKQNNKSIAKVTMYVITNEGTFAMIIDNSTLFYNMGGKLLTAEVKEMKRKFYGDLEKKVNVTVDDVIKQVAKSLPAYGISLFKATDSNLNNWNKIIYNPETDQIETPSCI